eukprot:scaffold32295_cov74-Phaeocystis_antarctica.AAC.2
MHQTERWHAPRDSTDCSTLCIAVAAPTHGPAAPNTQGVRPHLPHRVEALAIGRKPDTAQVAFLPAGPVSCFREHRPARERCDGAAVAHHKLGDALDGGVATDARRRGGKPAAKRAAGRESALLHGGSHGLLRAGSPRLGASGRACP